MNARTQRGRRLAGWLLAALLALGGWSPAAAFVQRRNADGQFHVAPFGRTPALRYYLGTAGTARGVLSNEWTNVRAAFGQWQAVPGTVLRFEEGGTITGTTAIPQQDGRVDVLWVAPGTYPTPAFGEGTVLALGTLNLAITYLVNDEFGFQAVILINRNQDFLTGFDEQSANRTFLEAVVLHELGHVLGLNHSPLGGATMWWTTAGGVGPAAGLSTDEVAFAQAIYGTAATRAALGEIRGRVTRGGANVLGALVSVLTTNGLVHSAAVSGADGTYRLPGLPPGAYTLRFAPLDPDANVANRGDLHLVRGLELDVTTFREYVNGATNFVPQTNGPAVVAAGNVTTVNAAVTPGQPPFRITELRPEFLPGARSSGDFPLQLPPGASNAWVGVYLPGFAFTNATLRVSGDGLTFGATQVLPGALRQLTLVQAPVTVASNATPGLRRIIVSAGGAAAEAVGFAEVAAAEPDYNFDGLADRFQRRYFHPFTQAEAGPERDPDNDGFVNRREARMGSDPLDAASVAYRLLGLELGAGGARITGETAPGRRYQLWGRADTAPVPGWQALGGLHEHRRGFQPAVPGAFRAVGATSPGAASKELEKPRALPIRSRRGRREEGARPRLKAAVRRRPT
jgi:hypothetical protein